MKLSGGVPIEGLTYRFYANRKNRRLAAIYLLLFNATRE